MIPIRLIQPPVWRRDRIPRSMKACSSSGHMAVHSVLEAHPANSGAARGNLALTLFRLPRQPAEVGIGYGEQRGNAHPHSCRDVMEEAAPVLSVPRPRHGPVLSRPNTDEYANHVADFVHARAAPASLPAHSRHHHPPCTPPCIIGAAVRLGGSTGIQGAFDRGRAGHFGNG
jgi:hypothetical protein